MNSMSVPCILGMTKVDERIGMAKKLVRYFGFLNGYGE